MRVEVDVSVALKPSVRTDSARCLYPGNAEMAADSRCLGPTNTVKIRQFANDGFGASIAFVIDVTTGCDQYHSPRE
jgi:hypothetical protein